MGEGEESDMSADQSIGRALTSSRSALPIAISGVALAGLLAGLAIYHATPLPMDAHQPVEASVVGDNAAARPRAVQHPIACEKLPNVPGKSITTLLVEFPPNAFTPRHRHPGSVTAYVTKGRLRSQLNEGPIETYGTGGTWFEPPGTIHSMVENPSPTEPAEIMAIFVADSDCGALTIFDD
jgi:quercetin dioxygenase-like cupin family protein